MNIEQYRDYCLSFAGTTEGFPFDNKTLVFKVMNKMFALTDVDSFKSINLKCDPNRAISLRESYEEIVPGYHMSKKHWNTVDMNGGLEDEFIRELISHSYELVVASLPKKVKEELLNL
jgi:predicted DNA-binding protein (MmcQ/YjbR family)